MCNVSVYGYIDIFIHLYIYIEEVVMVESTSLAIVLNLQ